MKEKKKPGPKKKKIDPQAVQDLAAQGLTSGQIAKCLGVSWDTLDRRRKDPEYAEIAEAIKKGEAMGIKRVTNHLMTASEGGNVTASIFYLKNRDPGRWSDRQNVEFNINLNEGRAESRARGIEGEKVQPGGKFLHGNEQE